MRARKDGGKRRVVGERDEVIPRRSDGSRGRFEQLEHVDGGGGRGRGAADGDDGLVVVVVVCSMLGRRRRRHVMLGVVGWYIVVVEVPGACYRVEIVDDTWEEGVWVCFVRLGLVGWERGFVWDEEGEGGRIGGE